VSGALLAICTRAARVGAGVLRDLYGKPRDVHLKGRIDLVTDADRASEEAVLRALHELAPGASVLAEESGASGRGEVRFIVDPLDGTTNYASGLPLFACTVAAEEKGRVVAGCTIDPLRDEVFRAARGEGAWLGDRRLAVSGVRELLQSVMCTGFPYGDRDQLPGMIAAFGRFTELSRGTRRLGSAALDLAYLAAGRLDGFWEQGLHAWDVAAGQVLVEESGGLVTRFDGSALDLFGGEIAASGPALHAAILQVLRETRATFAPSR
jgi:myo-inositol-1(or 4)-monophosphatase